ncbi:hypothetical protein [Sulfitobacter pontiacus]|uniref:hypothetical protein n=1 Tax=Sulfitobacter pontiacus TaxID=60137 RepID=UPI00315AE395
MRDRQADERAETVAIYRAFKEERQDALERHYTIMQREARAIHASRLEELVEQRRHADQEADQQRQMRAAEREQAERRAEEQIKRVEQLARRQIAHGRKRDRGPSLS